MDQNQHSIKPFFTGSKLNLSQAGRAISNNGNANLSIFSQEENTLVHQVRFSPKKDSFMINEKGTLNYNSPRAGTAAYSSAKS